MPNLKILAERSVISIHCPACTKKIFDTHYRRIRNLADGNNEDRARFSIYCRSCKFGGTFSIRPGEEIEDGEKLQDLIDIVAAKDERAHFRNGLFCVLDRTRLDGRAPGRWSRSYECSGCGDFFGVIFE